MWIFMNNAMLSIVQHREMPEHLLVRARFNGDIEAVFDGYTIDGVQHTPEADYAYRATVHRLTVAGAIGKAVGGIDYDNFKNSIPKTAEGARRHLAYSQVWSTMLSHQQRHQKSNFIDSLAEDGEEDEHFCNCDGGYSEGELRANMCSMCGGIIE